MDGAEIRPASLKEIPACAALLREAFSTPAQLFCLTPENCPSHPAFMTEERLRQEAGTMRCFVLLAGGVPAGFVGVRRRDGDAAEMGHLGVVPAHRRRGLGALLVRKASQEAREMGASRLSIGIIWEHDELKAWYEGLGFRPAGTRVFPHLPFTVGLFELEL